MDKFIGKRLDGRYEFKELIGIGGMANVYKAYDIVEQKDVAIKILKEEFLGNEEFVKRFRNESKAVATLSHPNIVRIFDVNFGDRIQYIVMEYIDGITLKEFIEKSTVLSWKDTVHFTVQILRALQHAHDKGIVHRDIKPQNIMLLEDGTIKVMDFGIARFARDEHKATTDKMCIRDSTNVVRLSDSVYNSDSVAAIGVAAHEVGHAVQQNRGYLPMKIRAAIIPATQIGSKIAIPLFFIGLILSFEYLTTIGIILFSATVLFQLVTLPVEFNASRRALQTIEQDHFLEGGEVTGCLLYTSRCV